MSWPTRNIMYITSAIALHKNKQLPQRSNKQENALHSRCRSDRGLKSSEFGCKVRPKISHGMCSVKLNIFISCSNMLVHSSERSYGIYTSVVFATSKWYLELCTDDSSMHYVPDKNLSQLTYHPDSNSWLFLLPLDKCWEFHGKAIPFQTLTIILFHLTL